VGQAIGGLLPLAIGVALSPIPIIAVILMLGTPRAKTNGPAFAVGWVLGLVAVSVAIVLLTGGADDADSAAADGTHVGKIVLGVVLIAMAGRQWRKRPKPGEEPPMPKWMAATDHFTGGKSLGLGVLLSGVNPKNLLLTAAAAASIAEAGLSGGETATAIAVFVVVASITVVGAVLFYLLAPDNAKGPLATVKQFMADHNAVIMMVILLLLGAKILGEGIGGASS